MLKKLDLVKVSRKSALVKVSGDLQKRPEFFTQMLYLSKSHFTVICVGGGGQINKALGRKAARKPHGPLGREHENFDEKQKARDVLEKNRDELQDILAEKGIPAIVVIPVLDIGTVLCHVNGDEFLRTAYLGYDLLIAVTTRKRLQRKRKQFAGLPKIKVLAL